MWKKFNFANLNANTPEQIKWLQSELGVKADGNIGKNTIIALQNRIGTTSDGKWGKGSIAAATNYVSNITTNKENNVWGTIKSMFSPRKKENKSETKLSADEAQTLYKGASPTKLKSTISASVPLARILFSSKDTSKMDERTKDQLAVALTYYKDKINKVDSLDNIGQHGSSTRIKKLSPIGYKHEGFLSGQNSNANVQDVTGNPLSRVLGSFGAVQDKQGNFLIDDDYDNEIYRIPKKDADTLGISGLQTSDKDPDHYIATRNDFKKLQDAGYLKNNRLNAIGYVVKSLGKELIGNPEFSDESFTQRLKKIGENAIVRTGRSQKFDFVMSDEERRNRVDRLRRRVN